MSDPEPPQEIGRAREFEGRWVVIGIFAFAILMTAAMWIYWRLHVGPFVPLQQAILAEWEDSAPRVEGGQRKMLRGTPRILRITLAVPFDPQQEARKPELERRLTRLRRLASENIALEKYDILEVHFFHPIPEQEIRTRTFEVDLRDETTDDQEKRTGNSAPDA